MFATCLRWCGFALGLLVYSCVLLCCVCACSLFVSRVEYVSDVWFDCSCFVVDVLLFVVVCVLCVLLHRLCILCLMLVSVVVLLLLFCC